MSRFFGIVPCLIWFLAPPMLHGAEFFVAPEGSDANPGTVDQPLATLVRAQELVRQRVRQGLDSDVNVWIKEGTYVLSEPLVFNSENGGDAQFAVVYSACPGEKVIVSGGRPIYGWQPGDRGVWTAATPCLKEVDPRNLFVNGRRATRARTPNQDAEPSCVQLTGAGLSEDRSRFTLSLPTSLLGDLRDAEGLEVMVAGNWAINRKRVERIQPNTGTLILSPPHRHGPAYIFPSTGRWCCLQNTLELLDEPGEWCHDRQTGVWSYRPEAGDEMAAAQFVAPVLRQLIRVQGMPERPVRNLHFKGLQFAHTDWQLPAEGYMGIQACHYGRSTEAGRRWNRISAAVHVADAVGCSIEDCVVAHLGGSGIELADGCRECIVHGNRIFDVSGNGIMVGGPQIDDRVPRGCRVSNNHISGCGREYYGAIGIWLGFAQGTVVSHNLVHGLPYTGISLGWEWSPNPTPCKENRIELNHVYDVMNRLCDGGCIYTLGLQPGTVIRGNHLHGVQRSVMAQGAPNNGMFIDQGSKGYLLQQNVIYDTDSEPIRFNQCQRDWHTWQDNYIGDETMVKEHGREIIEQAGLESPWKDRAQ